MNGLVPRVSVGVALDVGCVSVGLAVLRPCATCLRVIALHVCGVAVSLDVVRVA